MSEQNDTRPNIILIMADDMGFSDLGCYGGEINTPNLDSLAENGIRFTNFYNCARCCPTRASLLTGLYPHEAGIGHMTSQGAKQLKHYQQLEDSAYLGMLNNNCVTIAEVLQKAGYQTFMSGKWHAGQFRPQWPVDRGFDKHYGLISGGTNYFKPSPNRQFVNQDEIITEFPDDFYTTDYFTKYAVEYIDEADSETPFFLYLAYNAPHWPLHAWPEDIAKYRGSYKKGWDQLRDERMKRQHEIGLFGDEAPLSDRDPECPPWDEEENIDEWDLRMSIYAAQVDSMDQGIGKVLEALDRKGCRENTVVMFLSDNGACAETIGVEKGENMGAADSYTSYFLPWANASNTPFRLFKHWTHEGGICTPFIVSWPDKIKAPRIDKERIGHVKDFMATCMELGKAEYPEEYKGNQVVPHSSVSLVPAFKGENPPQEQVVFWEHEGNRALRSGKWKLVSYYNEPRGYKHHGVGNGKRTGEWQLYNLETDRTELNDLACEKPEKLKELISIYTRIAGETRVKDWELLQKKWGNIDDGDI